MKPLSNSLSLSSSCLFLFSSNSVREGGEADLAGASNKERPAELDEAFTTLEDAFELVERIGKLGWR